MQNIHVKRYDDPTGAIGYLGTVEPEDRAWILFIAADGTPSLWRRVQFSEPGVEPVEHAYADVEDVKDIG
jgi:hypothetical protein